MSFDVRQLRYAVAAADHGSFYRAARAMEVDQSTLSRNILKLERSVGTPIFERSRSGVTLTLAGNIFIRSARPMLTLADKLASLMRAASQGRAGSLRIGHNGSISAGNLRAILMSWHEGQPDVEVEYIEADRGVLLAGLDTGEIDMAILIGTGSQNGFRCESLWSERILVALPGSHPLAECDVVHWTDLRNERFHFLTAEPGPNLRDLMLGRLAGAGGTPEIKMHRASREALLSMLGYVNGISIICESFIGTRYPDIVFRAINGEQGSALINFSGYWRDDNHNPALRRFLGFIGSRLALAFDISPQC